MKLLLGICALLTAFTLLGEDTAFLGRDVCAGCHKSIATTQVTTAMARTWQGTETSLIDRAYSQTYVEGPNPALNYEVSRNDQALSFAVQLPGHPLQKFAVEATMGGRRHGLSFLFRVPEVEGIALPRAPLVEGRYLHYTPKNHLELSPGFPTEKPANYERAFGRVLMPRFERKCLTCHGEPRAIGSHKESGVTCESCHGAGPEHLKAVSAKTPDLHILNPAKQPVADRMQTCAQCHSGFRRIQQINGHRPTAAFWVT
jgi:hypothetical protein